MTEDLANTGGWHLTTIDISNPVGTHSSSIDANPADGGNATFDLDAGETVIVTFTNAQLLQIEKTSDDSSVVAGDTINYTITATNIGNITLTGVTVTDPKVGTLTYTWPGAAGVLGPGGYVICEGSYTTLGADVPVVQNIATADSDQTYPISCGHSVLVTEPPP